VKDQCKKLEVDLGIFEDVKRKRSPCDASVPYRIERVECSKVRIPGDHSVKKLVNFIANSEESIRQSQYFFFFSILSI
jgi:hypothetical protein